MSDFIEQFEKLRHEPVYLILGVQGSGTNLISKLMRRVFKFSVVQDRCLIFDSAAALLPDSRPEQVRKRFDIMYRSLFPGPLRKRFAGKHYHHQNKNYRGIKDHFPEVEIQSAADFADFVYGYHAYQSGAKYKAVKSDDLWERLDKLDQVIPNRRYIFLVRDCRDNALSIMNKNFGPRDIYMASEYVRHQLNLYREEVDRHPEPSLTMKYETILTNPRAFVEHFIETFEFTPVSDWEDQLAAFPIRSGNFDKWRRLPAEKIATSETVLKDELTAFGYELSSDASMPPSRLQRTMWRMKDTLQRVPQRLGFTLSKIIRP